MLTVAQTQNNDNSVCQDEAIRLVFESLENRHLVFNGYSYFYLKNRGAQALRALDPSHEVCQGGMVV